MASHTLFADRRALENEVAALGLDIRFAGDIQASLRPLPIANRTVGNRFAIHPMEGCDGTLDGKPDELTFRRWQRFGAGGSKLLWGEAVAIDPNARANTRQLLIADETLSSLEQLIALARKEHPGSGRTSPARTHPRRRCPSR
jgi:hypothetical protein